MLHDGCRKKREHCKIDGEDARHVAGLQEARVGEEDEGRRQKILLFLCLVLPDFCLEIIWWPGLLRRWI